MGVGFHGCRWVCDRLPLLAGGELTGTDRRTVERHLITCADCRDRRRSLAGALDALRSAAAVVPGDPSASPSLWPALERQIRESRRAPQPAAWVDVLDSIVSTATSPRFRSAAVLVAVLVGTGLTAVVVDARVRHRVAASRASIARAARPLRVDPVTAAPPVVLPAPVDALASAAVPRSDAPSNPPRSAVRVDYDLDRGTPMGDGGDVKASY